MDDRWTSSSDSYLIPQGHDPWAAEAAGEGSVGTQRLLSVDLVDPPDSVSRALGISDDEQVVVRRRLILKDDQPVELADSYYPARVALGTSLAENKRIKGGAVRVLNESGNGAAEVVEHVSAVAAGITDAKALAIGLDDALLVLERISLNAGGAPVEYAVMRQVAARTGGVTYRRRVAP